MPVVAALALGGAGAGPGAGVHLVPRLHLDEAVSASARAPRADHTLFPQALTAGLACGAAFVFPGLGHAVLGRYLPRGLAFTLGVVVSVLGAAAFELFGARNGAGALRPGPQAGSIGLMVVADVLELWSIVDASILALSDPGAGSLDRPRPLGAR